MGSRIRDPKSDNENNLLSKGIEINNAKEHKQNLASSVTCSKKDISTVFSMVLIETIELIILHIKIPQTNICKLI